MILSTTRFGALSVDETQFMEFPEGLPGFEDCRRFVPFEHAECGRIIVRC
jgi:flagellar assembly factor FliW